MAPYFSRRLGACWHKVEKRTSSLRVHFHYTQFVRLASSPLDAAEELIALETKSLSCIVTKSVSAGRREIRTQQPLTVRSKQQIPLEDQREFQGYRLHGLEQFKKERLVAETFGGALRRQAGRMT